MKIKKCILMQQNQANTAWFMLCSTSCFKNSMTEYFGFMAKRCCSSGLVKFNSITTYPDFLLHSLSQVLPSRGFAIDHKICCLGLQTEITDAITFCGGLLIFSWKCVDSQHLVVIWKSPIRRGFALFAISNQNHHRVFYNGHNIMPTFYRFVCFNDSHYLWDAYFKLNQVLYLYFYYTDCDSDKQTIMLFCLVLTNFFNA